MINISFGIIEDIEKNIEDIENMNFDFENYNCVEIADDIYIDDWWDRLILMKTYFHSLARPEFGLSRYGITLIPPQSLPLFQDIVISDSRIHEDESFAALADMIGDAIDRGKYMIHFGV